MAAMKISKSIRQMPWPDGWNGGMQDFIVTFSWPVVNHERLLVATFVRNRSKRHYYGNIGEDFRLVCSKKEKKARILYRGARAAKREYLGSAIRGFHANADTCYPEISCKDEQALARWLHFRPKDSHNHLIPQLNEWVKDAVDEEIISEKKIRGEIMDEDVRLCPEELPQGIVEFIRETVLPQDNVLIYKKGNVRGTCYLCREKVKAKNASQRFRQSEFVTCPNCGGRVYALLEGSDRFRVHFVENIVSIQKGTDGETVFVRQWHLHRDPTAQWENIPSLLEEVARYAVRGNKAAKWQHEAKENFYMNAYRYRLRDWTRVSNVHALYDGGCFVYMPDNWHQIFQETSLAYCDIANYAIKANATGADRYTVRFMVDWARYPVVEKFWKAGYTGVVHEKLRGFWARHRYAINWNKRTIAEAIKFPKRLLKLYKPEDWTMDKMQRVADIWEMVKAGKIKEREIPQLIGCKMNFKEIHAAFGHASVSKILRYAEKYTVYTYRDYLSDCLKLRWDLNDPQILFPEDLYAAHQRSIAQVRFETDRKEELQFQTTREKALWQEWEDENLLIRWPQNGAEIIAEGKALNHCVGGYVQRAAKGATTILFVRRKDEPGKPFFTLEWSGDHVVQCKGSSNYDYQRDRQVAAFVEAWVAHIKAMKQYKKKEKAA